MRKAEKSLEAAELLFEKGYCVDSVSRACYCIYTAKAALSTKDKDTTTHKGFMAVVIILQRKDHSLRREFVLMVGNKR